MIATNYVALSLFALTASVYAAPHRQYGRRVNYEVHQAAATAKVGVPEQSDAPSGVSSSEVLPSDAPSAAPSDAPSGVPAGVPAGVPSGMPSGKPFGSSSISGHPGRPSDRPGKHLPICGSPEDLAGKSSAIVSASGASGLPGASGVSSAISGASSAAVPTGTSAGPGKPILPRADTPVVGDASSEVGASASGGALPTGTVDPVLGSGSSSLVPSGVHSAVPSGVHSAVPSGVRTCIPPHPSGTGRPSGRPSGAPSGLPSGAPSGLPSGAPSGLPSGAPSGAPTGVPSADAVTATSIAVSPKAPRRMNNLD